MEIIYSRQFIKQYKKCPAHIKKAFQFRLNILLKDRYNPLLHNHKLRGPWDQYSSINITGDWRAVFRIIKEEDKIFFIQIGTHNQLYS